MVNVPVFVVEPEAGQLPVPFHPLQLCSDAGLVTEEETVVVPELYQF